MKRDLLVLTTCLCLLMLPILLGEGRENVAATFASGGEAARTLILDAGHGGEDGGASSASGDRESDINLAITLKIEQIMGLCGIPTVLTRSQDISIHDKEAETIREKKVSDLKNRVALVERVEGGLLLSIHQNSFHDSRYSGAQVFYGRADESRLWAERTQELLRVTLDTGNERAAKPIPDSVYLMNHITCPAILVECGFLSNGAEASLLLTPGYQKKVATALAGACLQYIKTQL